MSDWFSGGIIACKLIFNQPKDEEKALICKILQKVLSVKEQNVQMDISNEDNYSSK